MKFISATINFLSSAFQPKFRVYPSFQTLS